MSHHPSDEVNRRYIVPLQVAYASAMAERDRLAAQNAQLLSACRWFIDQCRGDSGTGETHWEQFPEYRAARAAIAATQSSP